MAGYKWFKKALLFKMQPTPGVDPVPTGALNAIEGINVEIEPIAGNSIERAIERPYIGHAGEILVETHVRFTFQTELQSSGTLGTAPAWGPLARGASAAEVIDPGVDVRYSPITDNQEIAAAYFYIGNSLHKILDCRGNGRLVLNANQIPVIEWTFMGLYVPPVTGAAPAVTVTNWIKPIPASMVNTPTFQLFSTSLVGLGFNLDFGNELVGRFLIGQESIEIPNRRSVGEMTFQSPDITTKNFFADAVGRVADDLSIVHGTVAGRTVEVAAPKVEIGRPSYYNDRGIVMMRVPLIFTPDAGNDEWELIAR